MKRKKSSQQRGSDLKLSKKSIKAIDDFFSPMRTFTKSKKFKRGY